VGIDDRDAAYALRGQEISVAKSDLPPPEENEFTGRAWIGLKSSTARASSWVRIEA
jgi:16S rRNA processing protein RimM